MTAKDSNRLDSGSKLVFVYAPAPFESGRGQCGIISIHQTADSNDALIGLLGSIPLASNSFFDTLPYKRCLASLYDA